MAATAPHKCLNNAAQGAHLFDCFGKYVLIMKKSPDIANTGETSHEKNLISRRTLLNNGIITGIGLVTGFSLPSSLIIPNTTDQKPGSKMGSKKDQAKSDKKSRIDTYIDNFDC